MTSATITPAALILAIGICLGGYFVGSGFEAGRTDRPVVTVKGLAERNVRADLASWTLQFTSAGNRLSDVQQNLAADSAKVRDFLEGKGIPAPDITTGQTSVTDMQAQTYNTGASVNRFIVTQRITVVTREVDAVNTASSAVGDLVAEGVVLPDIGGPRFRFTGLNGIKPALLAEATANARAGADQFANDSGAEVGDIRRANQGVIQILPAVSGEAYQEGQEIDKIVRVVSTIDYYLEKP